MSHILRELKAEGLAGARGGQEVFVGVSFTLRAGAALLVKGANGSGKSTLLRMIAGLQPPSAGRLDFDEMPEEGVHYVGHEPGLTPGLSIRDNLRFMRSVLGGSGDIEAALDRVGLLALAARAVRSLSAGERRRLALARLLVAPRALWLLDEPAVALDAAGLAAMGRIAAGHLAGGGIIIAATHTDIPFPARMTLTLQAAA